MDQSCKAKGVEHILSVVRGGAVRPQRDVGPGREQLRDRCEAAPQSQVAGGIMDWSGAALSDRFDVLPIDPDSVRKREIGP